MRQTKLEGLFKIDCGDIYLQEFSIEDVESIYRISNTPEIFNFLPDWKSTKEQRLNWVTNYEIPANKEFLEAIATTSNLDNHFLKLGVFIKETNEFIYWLVLYRNQRRVAFTEQRNYVCHFKCISKEWVRN